MIVKVCMRKIVYKVYNFETKVKSCDNENLYILLAIYIYSIYMVTIISTTHIYSTDCIIYKCKQIDGNVAV